MTDDVQQLSHDDANAMAVRAEHKREMAVLDTQLTAQMPIALRVFFDERLFTRMRVAAEMMSKAEGFVPRHLIGKSEACFAVISKALGWSLDPYAVAGSTYQTPDGKVGYEGKLVQAIIEQSGRFRWAEPERGRDGRVIPGTRPVEYLPSEQAWLQKVQGKFRLNEKTSQAGKKYHIPEQAWTPADEEGLGIKYRFHVDGGPMREWTFYLRQAVIRNSTLWPTDPMTQCHYAAIRRLASVACPSLVMGVPFRGDEEFEREEQMRDISPPKAPEMLDLSAVGVAGAGHMTQADERAQQEQPQVPQAQPDDRPTWVIDGKTYVQPGRVQSVLIGRIGDCHTSGDVARFERDYGGAVASLLAANRQAGQAVEQALDHQRSVVEAEQAQDQAPEPDYRQGGLGLIQD